MATEILSDSGPVAGGARGERVFPTSADGMPENTLANVSGQAEQTPRQTQPSHTGKGVARCWRASVQAKEERFRNY